MSEGIDYILLAKALEYYGDLGYQNTTLDWVIPKEYNDITMPPDGTAVTTKDGILVGSAEQSFLKAALTDFKWLYDTKAQAITPCFRNDKEDLLHKKYFMKLELFRALKYHAPVKPKQEALTTVAEFINAAYSFFHRQLKNKLRLPNYASEDIVFPLDMITSFTFRPDYSRLPTLEVISTPPLHPTSITPYTTDLASFDIQLTPQDSSLPIELGSYGVRCYNGPLGSITWVYGTGLALPRLTTARAINGNL